MKNALKDIQDSVSPQNTYYFQIQCDHLILPQNILKNSLFKDSYIQILLMKDDKLIESNNQPIRSTILGQKLLLNFVHLKFSATLFDIQRNIPVILKIIKLVGKKQQQLSQFKLVPAKYAQCYNVEDKKFFDEKFKSKLGITVQMLVFIQKSRSKLQNIIRQVQTQKRQKRSQSAKKSRLKSPLMRKIFKNQQNSYQDQQSPSQKQKFSKTKYNKNIMKSFTLPIDSNQTKIQKQNVRKSVMRTSRLQNATNTKGQQLKISKITELNSQQYSQLSRSFENSRVAFNKQIEDLQSQIIVQQEIQQAERIISQLSQQTSKQLQQKKIISNFSAPQSNIFSQEQQSSLSISRRIVLSQTQDSTSMSSSRISSSSDLNHFRQKRNRTFYIILLFIAIVLLINALVPSRKNKKVKKII